MIFTVVRGCRRFNPVPFLPERGPMANRRKALSIAASAALPIHSLAQEQWPSRPLRIINPSAPGGTNDVLCRVLAEPLAKILGQPVIIESKPGAGGLVGTQYLLQQPADGYTIVSSHNGFVTAPLLSPSARYDPLKDFAAVSLKAVAPIVLLAHSSMPASLGEFTAYARAQAGKLEWGTAALGGVGHLGGELFHDMAGLKGMVRVAYNGAAPALQALVTGEIKYLFSSFNPATAGMITEGRIRLLGVSTPTRSPLFPNATAIAEVVPGFRVDVWYGFLARAGTPAPVLKKLGDAIEQVVALPEVIERYRGIPALAKGGRAELSEAVRTDHQLWSRVIKEKNIKLDA